MFPRHNLKDRWLISYADFITVLFAMFVLMYATAKAKEQKRPVRTSSATTPATIVNPNPPAVAAKPQSNLLTDLRDSLQVEQQNGLVTLSTEQRGIVIALDDRTCFQPGQATVDLQSVPMFEKVGGVLSRYTNRILLEGHTDSVPIHNKRFRSNWELSTARSIAVLELFEQRSNIPADRFLIGGSADNTPVSSNETEQGRAHNRRVEIVVLENAAPVSITAAHPISAAVPAK
jgi:chemotaxis protein MotB